MLSLSRPCSTLQTLLDAMWRSFQMTRLFHLTMCVNVTGPSQYCLCAYNSLHCSHHNCKPPSPQSQGIGFPASFNATLIDRFNTEILSLQEDGTLSQASSGAGLPNAMPVAASAHLISTLYIPYLQLQSNYIATGGQCGGQVS